MDPTGVVAAERARWLAAEPARYSALMAEGEAALQEFAALALTWEPQVGADKPGPAAPAPIDVLKRLGRVLEPDILFLSPDEEGRFRLRGGALCFPTGWALEDKMGQTLDFIHDVVPGLNPTLAAPIHQFLSKLKPGVAFLRDNWGVAATDELNLHPARVMAPPALPVTLDRLWLRVEHQALMALPVSRGIVFGIRIALHRLDTLAGTPAGAGLRQALAAMPVELASYKRLERMIPQIIGLL